MEVDAVTELVRQFRETFEGDVGSSWITDGKEDSGVLGYIDTLTPEQAATPPFDGAQSVAGHVAHLRFSLDLFVQRIYGQDPPADWANSFNLNNDRDWESLRTDLHRAYAKASQIVEAQARTVPLADWPDLFLVGLCALIAHNAYHLGAIRQVGNVVRAHT